MADPNDVPVPASGGELPAEIDAAIAAYGSAIFDCGFFPPGPIADGTSARILTDRAALVSVILGWGAAHAEAARRHALDEAVQMAWKTAEEYSVHRESTLDDHWLLRSATAQVLALRLRAISSAAPPPRPEEAEPHPVSRADQRNDRLPGNVESFSKT